MKAWDQPWKRREPGGRLNKSQKIALAKSEIERVEMNEKATQKVKIVFHKKLWHMNQFPGVTLEFSIPLRMDEIRERMHNAFPELAVVWEENKPGAH